MRNSKKVFLALLSCSVLLSAHGKIRIGTSGSYVEVTNSNEHYLEYVRHMKVPFESQTGAVWTAGDNVTGKTAAEIQQIVNYIKALETDPIQAEMFDKMIATSSEWFTFTTVDHAMKTITQRASTISKMSDFNQMGWYGYHESHDGIPPSTTASMWDTGNRVAFYFRHTSGNAYDAINQLCDGSSTTKGECLGGIMACVWFGAAQSMGDTDFNVLYPGSQVLNMDFRYSNSSSRNLNNAVDTGTHVPGDLLYLKNYNYRQVIVYKEFHKKGWLDSKNKTYYWSGENSLYFGGGKYEGLGVLNKTEAQMRESLRNAYNSDLADVISNNGKMNGVAIEAITAVEAPTKIVWTHIKRLKN